MSQFWWKTARASGSSLHSLLPCTIYENHLHSTIQFDMQANHLKWWIIWLLLIMTLLSSGLFPLLGGRFWHLYIMRLSTATLTFIPPNSHLQCFAVGAVHNGFLEERVYFFFIIIVCGSTAAQSANTVVLCKMQCKIFLPICMDCLVLCLLMYCIAWQPTIAMQNLDWNESFKAMCKLERLGMNRFWENVFTCDLMKRQTKLESVSRGTEEEAKLYLRAPWTRRWTLKKSNSHQPGLFEIFMVPRVAHKHCSATVFAITNLSAMFVKREAHSACPYGCDILVQELEFSG